MVVNSFVFVDNFLKRMLLKAKETFQSIPNSLPDIAFQYFDITFGRQHHDTERPKKRVQTNPISTEGRKVIIDGCLECINLIQKIQTVRIPIVIIHSLQNNIVDVNQVYLFENTFESIKLQTKKEELSISEFMKSQRRRLTLLCQGGYALLDEEQAELLQYIEEFMKAPLSNNNTLSMIFVEKMLNELEDSLLSLQEREIEDCSATVEKLKNFRTMQRDAQDRLLKRAAIVTKTINTKIQETKMKIDKSIENFQNVKVKMSKYELNEETNEKILQNEERRLNDIQAYLENVVKMDQVPLNKLLQLAKIQCALDENYIKLETILLENRCDELLQKTEEAMQLSTKCDFDAVKAIYNERHEYYETANKLGKASIEGFKEMEDLRKESYTGAEECSDWFDSMHQTFTALGSSLYTVELKLLMIVHAALTYFEQANSVNYQQGDEVLFFSAYYNELQEVYDIIRLKQRAKNVEGGKIRRESMMQQNASSSKTQQDTSDKYNSSYLTTAIQKFQDKLSAYLSQSNKNTLSIGKQQSFKDVTYSYLLL